MKKLKHKKLWFSLIVIILLVCLSFVGAGYYFFTVACVPGEKSFLSSSSNVIKKSDPLYHEKVWFKKTPKEKWYMLSADGKYKLDANYIPCKNSSKTVIVLPGYTDTKEDAGIFDALFYELGYNTLTPEPRAQGESEGKYIGYGWPDKDDTKKWVSYLLRKKGKQQQIVIYGISMGGATAMMTSGLKLPHQVKAFIEDCGYTSVKDEIEYEAGALYNMPAFPRFPLVEILSGINKLKVGYFMGDASSVKQLNKNYRPMLFIHGSEDHFVPTKMIYSNYQATRGPKEIWVAPKAKHAKSFSVHPKEYKKRVVSFLAKYIK